MGQILNTISLINTDLLLMWVVCYYMSINFTLTQRLATCPQLLGMWSVVTHKITL